MIDRSQDSVLEFSKYYFEVYAINRRHKLENKRKGEIVGDERRIRTAVLFDVGRGDWGALSTVPAGRSFLT